MSETPKAAPADGPKLSEMIYVELIGRAFLRVDNAAQVKPDAATLAKLSMELADAFRAEEKERAAALGPKNVGYDITKADWLK